MKSARFIIQRCSSCSKHRKRRKAQKDKRSTQEMANSLAINTVNNIFNQRMMMRLKAIAIGKGDEPEEELPACGRTARRNTVDGGCTASGRGTAADQPAVDELPVAEDLPKAIEQPEAEEQTAGEADVLAQETEHGDEDSSPAGETTENEA